MLKIHILSDLHNEFIRENRINKNHNWKGIIPKSYAYVKHSIPFYL